MNTIVEEETELGSMPLDVISRLSDQRVLFVNDFIDDKIASDIAATLYYLNSVNKKDKITIFINSSHGADIRNVFMIYDVMKSIRAPVSTICIGEVSDAMVLILAAGTKGMRYATKNSYICTSPLRESSYGLHNVSNVPTLMNRIKRDNELFVRAMAKSTGKARQILTKTLSDDKTFSAAQAKKFGFIDAVVGGLR